MQNCLSVLTNTSAFAWRQTHEPPAQAASRGAARSTSLHHDHPPLLSQTPCSALPSPGSPKEAKQPLKTALTSLTWVGLCQFTSTEHSVQTSAATSCTTESFPCSSCACVCCLGYPVALFQKQSCLQFKCLMQHDSKKGAISKIDLYVWGGILAEIFPCKSNNNSTSVTPVDFISQPFNM